MILKKIQRAHLKLLLCLFFITSTALSELKTKVNPNIDYSWIEQSYFTHDPKQATDINYELVLRDNSPFKMNAKLVSFLDGINKIENKIALKKAYGLTNTTYFILARLAVGIMYAESKFGSHPKYVIKERFPWTVSLTKNFLGRSKWDPNTYFDAMDGLILGLHMEYSALNSSREEPLLTASELFDLSDNSRGSTQIKYLPPYFDKLFPHINKNNLHIPQYASVATIAYLANSIFTLAKLAQKYKCEIPKEHFLNHLLYLYVGRASEIVSCTATLDQNQYWRRALSVQKDLVTVRLFDQNKSSNLNIETLTKIAELESEIISRIRVYEMMKVHLLNAEKDRQNRLLIPPEDLSEILEYLIAAGFVTATHKALQSTLPSKETWANERTCKKVLIGRKRYFALLHAINSALVTKFLSDPNFSLNELFEKDVERQVLDELKKGLELESAIIDRLRLDVENLKSSVLMS